MRLVSQGIHALGGPVSSTLPATPPSGVQRFAPSVVTLSQLFGESPANVITALTQGALSDKPMFLAAGFSSLPPSKYQQAVNLIARAYGELSNAFSRARSSMAGVGVSTGFGPK